MSVILSLCFLFNSLTDAREALRVQLPLAPPENRAAMFRAFRDQYDKSGGEDRRTLLEFVHFLPPGLAAYTEFFAREEEEPIGADAGLSLTWEQLRLRIARWERFERQYPLLQETADVIRPGVRNLIAPYLFGLENNDTFLNDGRIDPKLTASYPAFSHGEQDIPVSPADCGGASARQTTVQDRALLKRFGFGKEFDFWWKLYVYRTHKRT